MRNFHTPINKIILTGLTVFHTLLCLSGCSSLRSVSAVKSDDLKETAIQTAIDNFYRRETFLSRSVISYVSFKDTVYTMTLKESYDGKSTYHWVKDSIYQELVYVGITNKDGYDKFYYKEGGRRDHLPSRYLIKGKKLFYWYDNRYPVTDEMIDVLGRYNLLQNQAPFWEPEVNGRKRVKKRKELKNADYFFCKCNLSIYKKKTNVRFAFSYHGEIPKIICDHKR